MTLWTEEETWYDSIVESIPSAFTAVSPGLIPAPLTSDEPPISRIASPTRRSASFRSVPAATAFRLGFQLRLEEDAGPLDRLLQRLAVQPLHARSPLQEGEPGDRRLHGLGEGAEQLLQQPRVARRHAGRRQGRRHPAVGHGHAGGRPCPPPFPSSATPRNRSEISLSPPVTFRRTRSPASSGTCDRAETTALSPDSRVIRIETVPSAMRERTSALMIVADLQAQPLSRGRQEGQRVLDARHPVHLQGVSARRGG